MKLGSVFDKIRDDNQALTAHFVHVWSFLIAVCALGAGWLSGSILDLYLGNNLPYCGRTVNMDKWSTPWWALFALAAFSVATAAGLAHCRRNLQGRRQRQLLVYAAVVSGFAIGIALALGVGGTPCT